ncbi:MFS transporter [Peptoniphilus lacrimalis]|uniref:MFS transporter n=1 Tax=Gardnerella TaxID=2701 RepID=UPI000C9A5C03|nr:MFS transporter [Gardnerella vaginalis]PMC44992.1 MFS transporter [Peptoniphilus lacrimalis]RDX00039.1 MFS transporter [Gardnerella vaginalis]RFT42823.1 MFS transporter [Bifidobacteriaceae bacterium N170]
MSSQSAQQKSSPMSNYAKLFSFEGTRAFCISGAIARLPISMMGLGIVLALNHIYNNWTIAGTMSAAYVLSQAAVTPLYAKLFDRFGQRKVGVIALSAQVVCMLSFATAALFHIPLPILFALAILMGVTQFAFGALVRTRWAYTLKSQTDDTLLNVAYALESGIDEIVFIFGPILAAWLATSVHPVSQLFVPVLASGLGGAWFLSLKNTQPAVVKIVQVESAPANDEDVRAALENGPYRTSEDSAEDSSKNGKKLIAKNLRDRLSLKQLRNTNRKNKSKNVLLYRGIIPLVVMFLVFNMSFSAFDVSVTAAMRAQGLDKLIGLQLALFACGSLVGAVIFGSHKFRGSNWSHLIVFLSLLTIGFILMNINIDRLVLLSIFELLSGLCVSPIFATGNLIVKDTIPEHSLTEGLSWLPTASATGASLGSMVAGFAIDAWSSHGGMMVPWISTLVAIPIASIGWIIVTRKRS